MIADELGQVLEKAIRDGSGEEFEVRSVEEVGGGCIHRALKVSGEDAGGKKNYFAKVNEEEKKTLFAAEAEGLEAIGKAGKVKVPRVIVTGEEEEQAYLVLEWLDLAPLDATSGASLGQALAAQHRLLQDKFGWGRDNFIGSSPQVNGWSDEWLPFWRDKRLHAQLRLAVRNRFPSKMIDRGERLTTDCDVFFRTYSPAPSLLHGDLWGGNAAALAGGVPVVFDPAVYVGDREADVAMTELFGGFPKEFRSAYGEAWPLDAGYAVRRNFYNLYHLLNHANLFAGDYVGSATRSIEKLLAEIR
jgi:protein-ribulosamine 3-kinase